MGRPRVLVLFAQEWDRLALADPDLTSRYEFIHAGFDLFRFPDNLRLLGFDVRAFIERLAGLARRRGVAGVISPHEQFGAVIAAVLARRLGLPGPEPGAVLAAQHKYHARTLVARVAPELNPGFTAFPYTCRDPEAIGLPFPFFAKPVKATFSVLARRVEDFPDLQRHLRFGPLEKYLIGRLIGPFDALLKDYPEFELDSRHILGEGLMEGMQVNVDGYADRGRVRILGVVDEVLYPGTRAFNRFEYPSSLPATVQDRLAAAATQVIRAVGFDHGLFNVELCYEPDRDLIRLIEINPRIASQFDTLYHWVDGTRLYAPLLDLALGRTPCWEPRPQRHAHAGSFVFRRFDGRPVRPVPGRERLAEVGRRHPDARLMLYLKRGAGLAREVKWLGSHRYAVLNLGGTDRADLYRRYRDIRDTLGFAAHSGPDPAPLWQPESPVAATGALAGALVSGQG